jgi:hypothetical protein
VALVRFDVSEERDAVMFRVEKDTGARKALDVCYFSRAHFF